MKRLFWVGVGAVGTVAALRKAREVTEKHVPAGARTALGAVAQVTTVVQAARRELAAGMAEREAELRADLLAGADLARSRERVAAWRAERAARSGETMDDVSASTAGAGPDVTGRTTARTVRRTGGGAHRLEDPEDGPAGYSFF